MLFFICQQTVIEGGKKCIFVISEEVTVLSVRLSTCLPPGEGLPRTDE